MRTTLRISLVLLGLLANLRCVQAQEANMVHLASAERPPYSGETLKQQGVAAAVVRAAFNAAGYRMEVEYFPWRRAMKMGKEAPNPYHGYFPEYIDSSSSDCLYSVPIVASQLGFAEPKAKPVAWSAVDDLYKLRVGIVAGYVNTKALDERIAAGQLQADGAANDLQNLLKLDGDRIDVAVIDKSTFNYLMRTAPALAAKRQNLEFNPRLLEDKPLHICFRRDAEGQRIERDFAKGMRKINVDAIVANYLKSIAE